MKDILDFVVLALFVFMVAMFIINFNRQQIKKHTDKLEKLENGAGFFHYVEVPMSSPSFRNSGTFFPVPVK